MRYLILLIAFLFPTANADTSEQAPPKSLEISDLSLIMSTLTDLVLIDMQVVEKRGDDHQNVILDYNIIDTEASKKPIEEATDNISLLKDIGRTMSIRRMKNLHILYDEINTKKDMCKDILKDLDQIKSGEKNDPFSLYRSTRIERFLNLYLYDTTVRGKNTRGFMTRQMRKYLYLNVDIEQAEEFSCLNDLAPVFPIYNPVASRNGFTTERELMDEGRITPHRIFQDPCEIMDELKMCLTELDKAENRKVLEAHSYKGMGALKRYRDDKIQRRIFHGRHRDEDQ